MARAEAKAVVNANDMLLELLRRFDEELGAYIETLEVARDKELIRSIKRGLKDIEEGRTMTLEELARKHGLEATV